MEQHNPDQAGQQNGALAVPRRIKACSTCRGLKIKCHMPEAGPPCTRCRVRGLQCIMDRDSRIWIKEYSSWRNRIDGQVAQMQHALTILLRHNNLPSLASYSTQSTSGTATPSLRNDAARPVENEDDLSLGISSRSTQAPVLDANDFNEPMNSLYEVTRLQTLGSLVGRHRRQSNEECVNRDLIARGLVSLRKAEELFDVFKNRLDHFLYGLMCPYETLDETRKSSQLLTASICTIAALHDPTCTGLFDACQREFLGLVARAMFSHSPSIDDIRAFIIGAFWLSNVSWTLSGHAIRMATGLQYHQAFYRALEGSERHFKEAQLWYILFILDHHWSIIYGRPPVLHEQEPFRRWGDFIHSPFATEADVRISSQVSLYLITNRAFEMYAGDNTKAIPSPIILQSRIFSNELDNWYRTWGHRLQQNPALKNFPQLGVILHYHFAKIYVCLHAFRGQMLDRVIDTSPEVKENVIIAINSAMSVLDLILQQPELRDALVGVHIYFHAMIAYSAMFLLKALMRFPSAVQVDAAKIYELIEQIVLVFKACESAEQHLAYHIADGLEKLLVSCRNESGRIQQISENSAENQEKSFQFPMLSDVLDGSMDSFGFFSQFPSDSGLDMFFTSEHP